MASVVVPFRSGGKSRLPAGIRVEVARAMLGDVLAAATEFGATVLVTADEAARAMADELGAATVDDPGGGQGAAVGSALAGLEGPCLVVNADLPRLRPSDLGALAVPCGHGAMAIVPARDGTTNALALPYPGAFRPLYGPGSAGRFRAHAFALGLPCHVLALRNVSQDVDTELDLAAVGRRAGQRTRSLSAVLGG